MLSRLFILAMLGFFVSTATAQTDSIRVFKDHALQLGVRGLFEFNSFKGGLISYKYHTSDKTAYRIGISARGNNLNVVEDNKYFRSDTLSLDHEQNRDLISLGITAEYLHYFNPADDLKMFFGVGPRLAANIGESDTERVTVGGSGISYTQDSENISYQIGLTLNYGLEWFFRHNMSLHAEYGFRIYYLYDKDKSTRIRVIEDQDDYVDKFSRTQKGIIFGDTNVLIGLSLYF